MTPRLEPLPIDEWDDRTRQALGGSGTPGNGTLNIFGTLARHPDLLRRWLVFGTHVLAKSTLSARHRELLILRVGWLCRAPYEWGQHVVIARREGITDEEIARIAEGPDASGWDPFEAVLIARDRRTARRSMHHGPHVARPECHVRRATTARCDLHRRSVHLGVDGVELVRGRTRRRRRRHLGAVPAGALVVEILPTSPRRTDRDLRSSGSGRRRRAS